MEAASPSEPIPAPALRELVEARFPGARLLAVRPLSPDAGGDGAGTTTKAAGYGRPLLLIAERAGGEMLRLVFRTGAPGGFGHDRRSDRAADAILAFDRFGAIPRHVRALDVGAIDRSGALRSLASTDELYLLTEYAPGEVYASDLRAIARGGALEPRGERRLDALVDALLEIHRPAVGPSDYRRAVRDVVGHGEGVFGVLDSYPEATPAAAPARLHQLEQLCQAWRWRLRAFEHRGRRIHGDFHPFNLLFHGDADLRLLDASRGCAGDPADDVTALAVNYVFFAVDAEGAWQRGLGDLWRRLWTGYARRSGDGELLLVAPLFLAWRLLVVCNPVFYPDLSPGGRDRLLGLAERALTAERFDPMFAEELFR